MQGLAGVEIDLQRWVTRDIVYKYVTYRQDASEVSSKPESALGIHETDDDMKLDNVTHLMDSATQGVGR